MSIDRIKPLGWSGDPGYESITSLDENITFMTDKRSGKTETISSDISVDGYVDISTGSLVIEDPADITISTGTLKIGAELNTKSFGYVEISLSTSTYTVLADEFKNFNIKFISTTSLGDVDIELPDDVGYAKIIENKCIGDGYIYIHTTSGEGVIIENGYSAIIYSDGTDIRFGSNNEPNKVIKHGSISFNNAGTSNKSLTKHRNYLASSSDPDNYIKLLNYTKRFERFFDRDYDSDVWQDRILIEQTGVNYPSSIIFEDVKIGDFFNVKLNAGLKTSEDNAENSGSIIAVVGYGQYSVIGGENLYSNEIFLTETDIRFEEDDGYTLESRGISNTFYTAVNYAGQYEFYVKFSAVGTTTITPDITVISPLVLSVTQYRRKL